MSEKNLKIGICGGTFDPIHYGHLMIAEYMRDSFKLDKVIFIPAGNPPHKKLSDISCAETRYEMVKLATLSNPYFEVSRIEIDREGITYTIDTLNKIIELYNNKTELYFITGADVIKEIKTWKKYDEIFKVCEFITALRPDFIDQEFYKATEYYNKVYNAKINIVNVPLMQISSTDIRQRIKNGNSVKYLLPESVEEYILNNGLYK